MKYQATRKCFAGGRVYRPGDVADFPEGGVSADNFVPLEGENTGSVRPTKKRPEDFDRTGKSPKKEG